MANLGPGQGSPHGVSTSVKPRRHRGRGHSTGRLALTIVLGLAALVVIGLIGRTILAERSGVAVAPSSAPPPSAELVVSAEQLSADYLAGEVAADRKYKDHRLRLTGVVDGTGKDILNRTYLTLRTPTMAMVVTARLETAQEPRAARLAKGDRVQLVCTGRGLAIGAPLVDDCRLE
jgi:hypothetical protein